MQLFPSKKTKIKLKILAWYQIVGGILGILLSFWLLAHTDPISGLILILYLIAFGLYVFSIYCGRLLLIDKYSTGLNLSIINQALQILSFSMFGYSFMYVSGMMFLGEITMFQDDNGFRLGLHFLSSGKELFVGFNFFPFSQWRLFFNSEGTPFQLAINFLAIYLIYFGYKLLKTTKHEKITYDRERLAEVNPLLSME
jgi:hypothetical protein